MQKQSIILVERVGSKETLDIISTPASFVLAHIRDGREIGRISVPNNETTINRIITSIRLMRIGAAQPLERLTPAPSASKFT